MLMRRFMMLLLSVMDITLNLVFAQIPGISSWPGKQMHSHNYRTPEGFQDQVAILIGSSASSFDLSREIAGVAKEVHVTSRSVADETYQEQPGFDNIWLHSMIESAHADGSVVFRNGRVVVADIIIHCTGYFSDISTLNYTYFCS
ncbi:hypothetical protein OIU78_010009 [Salix suchowensis]|nr:hypothetical protein OIU78_010009 [Salix suchowensis]